MWVVTVNWMQVEKAATIVGTDVSVIGVLRLYLMSFNGGSVAYEGNFALFLAKC